MGCEMKHCHVPASRNERIILLCQPLNFKNFSTPEAPFQGSSSAVTPTAEGSDERLFQKIARKKYRIVFCRKPPGMRRRSSLGNIYSAFQYLQAAHAETTLSGGAPNQNPIGS